MNRFAPGGPVGEKRVGKGQGGEKERVRVRGGRESIGEIETETEEDGR